MTSSRQLFDLQELDKDISIKRDSLVDVRARLEDNQALILARKQLETTQQRLSEVQSGQRAIDIDVEELKEKADRSAKKLYGGTVSNPRELSGMEEELRIIKSHQKQKEDSLLEVLVEVEEAQTSFDEARENLQEIEPQRSQEVKELTKAQKQLENELSKLGERRESVASNIDEASLSLYENLRKSRKGQAVAKVEQNTCQSCRIALPSKVMQQVRIGHNLVQCNSCGRILHMN